MTNYEWLKKHDYMPTFLTLLINKNVDEIQRRYGVSDEYVNYISDWLELEHKFECYVNVEDVTKIIREGAFEYFATIYDYHDCPTEENVKALEDMYLAKLYKLPKKELDD